MADKRTAYSDSSRRSEQLSCTKYFHPSYGLFSMIFQSLFDFLEFIHISKLNSKILLSPSVIVATVYGSGAGLTRSTI